MLNRLYSTLLAVTVTLSAVACNGGGGGSDDGDPCGALKIAGGQGCDAPPNALAIVSSSSGYCSGTFITTRHVLTAAHCVEGSGPYSIETSVLYTSVQRIQVHPQYNPAATSSEYDVAVLTIASNAPVSPVPLEESVPVAVGDQVVTYGFGLDQDGNSAYQRYLDGEAPLKATYLDVASVSDFSINTISDGSGDTCAGDSGGPALRTGSDGSYGIVALTRYGPLACEPYQPYQSENTNVQASSILNFIKGAAPGVTIR